MEGELQPWSREERSSLKSLEGLVPVGLERIKPRAFNVPSHSWKYATGPTFSFFVLASRRRSDRSEEGCEDMMESPPGQQPWRTARSLRTVTTASWLYPFKVG